MVQVGVVFGASSSPGFGGASGFRYLMSSHVFPLGYISSAARSLIFPSSVRTRSLKVIVFDRVQAEQTELCCGHYLHEEFDRRPFPTCQRTVEANYRQQVGGCYQLDRDVSFVIPPCPRICIDGRCGGRSGHSSQQPKKRHLVVR